MLLTINEVKQHLNIDEGFIEDDNYLQSLIDVSENIIENDIQRLIASYTSIPPALKHAAKILVATLYENREAVIVGVSINEVPYSYKYLIGSFKKYTIA